MTRFLRSALLSLLALLMFSTFLMAADKYSGTPAARGEFEKGKAAMQSGEWEKALGAYNRAVELDPNFAEAYLQLSSVRKLRAIGDLSGFGKMSDDERKKVGARVKESDIADTKKYEELVRQHPDKPIYRWVLAKQYSEDNPELEEKLCKEAVALDSEFGPAYSCIAAVANLRGDTQTAVQAYRKLVALDPGKTEEWLHLQRAANGDSPEYKAVTEEIVNKFPNTDTAVQALSYYAETLPEAEQVTKYEEIVAKYPPKKFRAAAGAAERLFSFYDNTDPAKADAFAHKMLNDLPGNKAWKKYVDYADGMAAAETKIAAND
ncbi:MAG: tetratricopeptide repeat protein, partial [Terriglobales bacterium]